MEIEASGGVGMSAEERSALKVLARSAAGGSFMVGAGAPIFVGIIFLGQASEETPDVFLGFLLFVGHLVCAKEEREAVLTPSLSER